jgi:hypothetical protein
LAFGVHCHVKPCGITEDQASLLFTVRPACLPACLPATHTLHTLHLMPPSSFSHFIHPHINTEIYEGTSEIQHLVIANKVLKEYE